MHCNGTVLFPVAEAWSHTAGWGPRQAAAGRRGTYPEVTGKGDTATARAFPALLIFCCVPWRKSLTLSVLSGLACKMGPGCSTQECGVTVRAPHPPRGFLSLASPPPHRPPCEPCGDCRGLPSGLPPRSSGRGHCCPCLLSRWHHHLPRGRRFSGRASGRRPWPGVGAELRESPREAAPQKQTPRRSPGRPRLLLQTEGRFPPDTSYVLRAACCCSSGSLTAPMSPHNVSTHPMHRRPFWEAESPPGTCTPVPAGSPTRCVRKSGSGSRRGWAAGSREPSGNAHGVGEQVLPPAVVTNSCRLCGPKQLWSFSHCSRGHKSARGSSDQNQGVGRMCAPAALGGVRSLPSPASGAASLPPRGHPASSAPAG